MGQDVVCQGCGKRLAIEDFTMGAAQTVGNRSYCRPCMPASEVKTILSPTPPPAVTPPPKRSLPLLLGAAAVGVLAVMALVVVFRPPKPASPPATASTPPRPTMEAELEALKIRAGQPLIEERFGAAISILREARKNHDVPEWTGPIDRRLRELQGTADGLHAQLMEQAVEARRRGALAEVEKIRQRVANWELPVYSSTLEQALAAIRLPDPVPGFGFKLIPGLGDAGRVHRRYGNTADKGVEAVPLGTGRAVGFEGDLFQVPSDGDVQVTIVTPTAQSFQVRLGVVGERGRIMTYEYNVRNAAAGTPVQVRAPFNRFTDGGRTLAGGSIVKQLHIQGQDSKVAFRVTELSIVKRRD